MDTEEKIATSSVYSQLEFETDEEAYDWYNEYARKVGFSIRKEYAKRDKLTGRITNRRFTCSKEGFRVPDKRSMNVKKPRKGTRTGCEAHMTTALRSNGKYRVIDFETCHNHEVVDASLAHILLSQRNINNAQAIEIDLADDSGIRPKLAFELITRHAGGRENTGFLYQDQKNYLRNKRNEDLKCGEAGSIMKYFQNQRLENPSFFYEFDIDCDSQITNMFWADAKMVMDYSSFGDVLFFDTTFRTNKECRPLGVFVGLNNHFQQVVFGASLLYDETAKSFTWLFEVFLKCMSGRKPKTFFTDQDHAMASAIGMVMPPPDTYHRLCLWHIHQNALKHVNKLFRGSKTFIQDFRKCIYDCEDEEEFLISWESMLQVYDIRDSKWLKSLFEVKEKWAMVYGREYFSAGKKSTQLCESFNSHLRLYLKSDLDLVQFFKHFERAVSDRRYKEKLANFDMTQRFPILKVNVPILTHAREIYTEAIFTMFQDEYEKSLLLVIDACIHDGQIFEYKISIHGSSKQCTVVALTLDPTFSCTCRNYEFMGILCCHILKVLDDLKLKMEVPEKYILKRWTKNARSENAVDVDGDDVVEDPQLSMSANYRKLCTRFVKMFGKAYKSKEACAYLEKIAEEADSKLDSILKFATSENSVEKNVSDIDKTQVCKLKKRAVARDGNSRYKSFIEKRPKKRGKSTQDSIPVTTKLTTPVIYSARNGSIPLQCNTQTSPNSWHLDHMQLSEVTSVNTSFQALLQSDENFYTQFSSFSQGLNK